MKAEPGKPIFDSIAVTLWKALQMTGKSDGWLSAHYVPRHAHLKRTRYRGIAKGSGAGEPRLAGKWMSSFK